MTEGGTHPAGVKLYPTFSGSFWFCASIVIWIYCASFVKSHSSEFQENFVHDHTQCNHRHPRPDEVRLDF